MLGADLIPLLAVADTLVAILGMVILFGVAVSVHELGHLMWAKAFGVGAEEFAVGFGKRLWSRKWGGTIYSIRVLPLGGFVKIKGMVGALEEAEHREHEEETAQRSSLVKDAVYESALAMKDLALWKKVLVFSGGVINNIILAWIIFFLMALFIGFPPEPDIPAVVGWIEEGSPAAEIGLQRGDEIIAVAGESVSAEAEARDAANRRWAVMADLLLDREGQSTTLTIRRGGETLDITWTNPASDEEVLLGMIAAPIPAHIAAIVPHGPAERAGLREGDTIVEIDGAPIEHWRDLQGPLAAAGEASAEVVYRREGELRTATLVPAHKDYIDEESGGRWTIGFFPGLPRPEGEMETESFLGSLKYGLVPIVVITVRTYDLLWRMVTLQTTGQEVKDSLGGPVMIFNMGYRFAAAGFDDFLYFAGALNVLLALFNILPYPILDGGHIMFNIIESIRRRPLSLKTLERVYGGAFALLLVFVAWVTLKDVFMIFG